jgi:hypothetical protein
MMNGYYSDEKVGPVLELVAIALESEATVSTQNNACSDLYALGVEKKVWQSVASCSRTLRVDRGVLTRILKADPTAFAQEEPTYLQQLLQKMRLALGPVAVVTPSNTKSTRVKNDVQGDDADVLSGQRNLPDQTIDGLDFVLNVQNFHPLKGRITKAGLDGTKQLIRELRRRIGILLQIDEKQERLAAKEALDEEIAELIIALPTLATILPTKALVKMERDRKALGQL